MGKGGGEALGVVAALRQCRQTHLFSVRGIRRNSENKWFEKTHLLAQQGEKTLGHTLGARYVQNKLARAQKMPSLSHSRVVIGCARAPHGNSLLLHAFGV